VLANRLSEDPKNNVLLLEAGGRRSPLPQSEAVLVDMLIHSHRFGKTLNDKRVNWLYETEVDEGSGGRRHKWPKARSWRIVVDQRLFMYRGQQADYDALAEMGCEGLSYSDCCPIFRRAEHQDAARTSGTALAGRSTSPIIRTASDFRGDLEAAVEAGIRA